MPIRDRHAIPLRKLLAWAGLAVALALLGFQIAAVDKHSLFYSAPNFAMYWVSGRLHLMGENPYDPQKVLPWVREFIPNKTNATIMYSPPWMLPVVLPFSLMGFHAGRVAWLLVHAFIVLFCADGLWRFYEGPNRYRWIAWCIAFSLPPTLLMLQIGQIASLLLLGAVGFLHFQKRGSDLQAGASLALMALKPHVAYLFLLALLLWVIQYRRWRVASGALIVVLLAAAVPLLINPAVYRQYWNAMTGYRPTAWPTLSLGYGLRLVFGWEREWLQFVPMVPGMAWLLAYWAYHRNRWDWAQQAPLLILVSSLTTCYGFSHDYVLFLVPILQVACSLARDFRRLPIAVAVAVYLSIIILYLALNLAGYGNQAYYLWMSPTFLLAYLGLRQRDHRKTVSASL